MAKLSFKSGLGKLVREEPGLARKLEPDLRRDIRASDEATPSLHSTAVIIHVSQPDYVPPGVTVRARLSPQMFTANVPEALLTRLASDARVVSIGQAKPLPNVD